MTNYPEPNSIMESKRFFFRGPCEESVILQLFSSMVILISRFMGSKYCGLMFKHFVPKCASSSALSAMKWEALALLCRHQTHAAYHAGRKCMRPTLLAVTARGAEKHVAGKSCTHSTVPQERVRISDTPGSTESSSGIMS